MLLLLTIFNFKIDGSTPRYRILLDGSLQIINLYQTDSGIYLCVADNGIGHPLQRQVQLQVTGKKLFVIKISIIMFGDGTT